MSDIAYEGGIDAGVRETPIRELIGELEQAMGRNDELVSKLTEQLSPILEPEPPLMKDGNMEGSVPPSMAPSEVRERLMGLIRRIEQRNTTVLKLANRINL